MSQIDISQLQSTLFLLLIASLELDKDCTSEICHTSVFPTTEKLLLLLLFIHLVFIGIGINIGMDIGNEH